MSKVANMINMVIYLSNRELTKIRDIAEYLEVSESNVRKYKTELEQACIYIETVRGRYGGYKLNKQNLIKNIGLSLDEKLSFKLAKEYLVQKNDFVHYKNYESGLNKIIYEANDDTLLNKVTMINKGQKNAFYQKEEKYFNVIYNSILKQKKIKIDYYSLSSNENKVRVVHPYGLIIYKGYNYLVGFCELRKKILDFKLIRINDLDSLKEKFITPASFNMEDHKNLEFGIVNDEMIDIELVIDHPKSQIVKESIFVENQEIIELSNGIIFKAKMHSKKELISWILSMGSSVKSIKPNFLRVEIAEEIKKLNININTAYILSD